MGAENLVAVNFSRSPTRNAPPPTTQCRGCAQFSLHALSLVVAAAVPEQVYLPQDREILLRSFLCVAVMQTAKHCQRHHFLWYVPFDFSSIGRIVIQRFVRFLIPVNIDQMKENDERL